MKNLINILSKNNKIDSIKTQTIESLEDEIKYKKITAVIKTKRNLFGWAKSIYIQPSEKEGFFNVEILMDNDPKETLLKDIYNSFKTEEWEGAKYGHQNVFMKVLINENDINKIVNWFYSKIN
jgi:hypothetical protein